MTFPTFDEAPPAPKGPSLVVQIAVLLGLTVVAVGGGWFAGGHLRGGQPAAAPEAAAAPTKASGHGEAESGHGQADAHGEAAPAAGHPLVVPLAPITTNLAEPADVWLRMELSVVFDKAPEDPGLADSIHQDLLAYVRTLKLHQIQGASGFLHLREDLQERAEIRSAGVAKRLLIRTLLLE